MGTTEPASVVRSWDFNDYLTFGHRTDLKYRRFQVNIGSKYENLYLMLIEAKLTYLVGCGQIGESPNSYI